MDRELRKQVVREVTLGAYKVVPNIAEVSQAEVDKIAARVMEQDPWWGSKRIHASLAAVLVLVFGAFGISWEEAQLVEAFAAVAALAAAVLPLISKVSDKRIARTRGGKLWPD